MQNSCFFYVVYIQRSRNTNFSCYDVTPLPENYCSTLFKTGDIRHTSGGSVFALGALCFGSGAFGFLLWEAFGREKNC
jgi:hypothetical protein